MVSEGSDSNPRGSRPYVLLDSFDNLESELALLRDSVDRLRISNGNLQIEVQELTEGIAQLNQRLDDLPTGEEVQIQAQPIEEEDRPLQIGDSVRITSRQHFGVEGTVHSFTNQRIRVQIEDRCRPIIRSATNLQRIN